MSKDAVKTILDEMSKELKVYKTLTKAQKNKEVLKLKIIGRLENPSGINSNPKLFAIGYYEDYQVFIPSDTLFLDNLEGVIDENGNSVNDYVKNKCVELVLVQ